jgi:hypothetical protein
LLLVLRLICLVCSFSFLEFFGWFANWVIGGVGSHANATAILWMEACSSRCAFVDVYTTRVICVSSVTHEVLDSIYTKYILGASMIFQCIIFALVFRRFLHLSFVRFWVLHR